LCQTVGLAAGSGTRPQPLTDDKPKGLVEVDSTPLIEDMSDNLLNAAFLVEEVPYEEASRYGVLDTNEYGEVVEVVEKPDDPPSNLVMTGFYTFTPAIFHACHLVQPSDRGEYEPPDAIDLLIESGRTIDAIRLDGWRIDVGYPEDRDRAEERLTNETEVAPDSEETDEEEAVVDN